MIDQIVIVGAGRTSQSLVRRLASVAPIVVIDTSSEALAELDEPPGEAAPAPGSASRRGNTPLARAPHPVKRLIADGTSRLVLQDVKVDGGTALVAATGSDRRNLEVCRLGAELGFTPLVAIVIDPATTAEYQAHGARAIVRASLLGDVVEQAIRYDGIAVASNVGLGKGDLIEIRILSSSPAIGQRLIDLRPEGWRVAAIYRGGDLVMPTGSTRVQADDRMLLVGDPEILPYIGEKLRLGLPDFPLRYGPNIVLYLPRGPDPAAEAPVRLLAEKTRAVQLVRVQPEGGDLEEHVRTILSHEPGLLVVRPIGRKLVDRLAGRGGRAMRLCNQVPVPVLFLGRHGGEPERVILATEGHQELRAADTAIDLARMLSLPLTLLQLEMPAYLGGDPQRDRVAASLQQRAGLYGLRTTTEIRVGNPVTQALGFLAETDLCVVARRRSVRDGFTSPDVALRIARASRAATLVLTV